MALRNTHLHIMEQLTAHPGQRLTERLIVLPGLPQLLQPQLHRLRLGLLTGTHLIREAIRGHQRSSVTFLGLLSGTHLIREAIRGHQRSSVTFLGLLSGTHRLIRLD